MRVHDTGPRTETDHSDAKKRFWGHDYGTQGGSELERPFIDDEPSPFDQKTAIGGFFHRAWARIRRVVGGPVGRV